MHIASIQTGRGPTPGMHRHDFFECFLTLDGLGRHERVDGSGELGARELHFIRPEQAHSVRGAGPSGLHFLNIAFSPALWRGSGLLQDSLLHYWKPGRIPHSLPLDRARSRRLQDLGREAARGPHGPVEAIGLLATLLQLVQGGEALRQPSGLPDWLRDGLEAAAKPAALRSGLPALLQACGRSQEHVNRVFRHHLATTPTAWICRQRLKLAASLLRSTSLPLLDLALECGFESPSYFHRRFQEAFHTTPLRYRRENRRILPPPS